MEQRKDGGPAFPTKTNTEYYSCPTTIYHSGLSLRDYFAAHAPEPYAGWRGGQREFNDIIDWRWYYADAMLREREA